MAKLIPYDLRRRPSQFGTPSYLIALARLELLPHPEPPEGRFDLLSYDPPHLCYRTSVKFGNPCYSETDHPIYLTLRDGDMCEIGIALALAIEGAML